MHSVSKIYWELPNIHYFETVKLIDSNPADHLGLIISL
jgi:hypothetical protein